MVLSLPDLPVELLNHALNFIPSKENAIISVRETCRTLALKTTEIFARKYFSRGSWRLTRRTVLALTKISKNKYLNPAVKHIVLFRYINKYEPNSRYSLAKGIDIKELGQSLQTLANLRSLCLADFNFRGSENFLGDLLATLSLPSITYFKLLRTLAHASDLQKFITLHSDTIKSVKFDELDLTAPAKGAWSGLLSSLTWLKDVKLIHIRKPLKRGYFVRFESKDTEYSTSETEDTEYSTFETKDTEYSIFERYVELDTEYDRCDCDFCFKRLDFHGEFAEYRLGTDAEKEDEDWTRGLELMAAGSRTVDFRSTSQDGSILKDKDPDP